MKIGIAEEDTGGRNSLAFRAYCDGAPCGHVSAYRASRKIGGKVVYAVNTIDVDEAVRRRGVATALYEAAANEACRRRGRLASTARNPGAYSNDFWLKQEAKGRAVRVRQKLGGPAFVLVECPPKGYSVDLSRLWRRS